MAVETGSSPHEQIPPHATKMRGKLFAPRPIKGYIHPYLAGALLGVVLFTAFFLTGNGLGASGGLEQHHRLHRGSGCARPHRSRALPGKDGRGRQEPAGFLAGVHGVGHPAGRLHLRLGQRPPQGGDRPRAAHHRPHPLVHGLPGRGDHGLRRAHGARLHLRPGPLRRRGALGRLVGLHVRRLRRRLRRWPISCASFWN